MQTVTHPQNRYITGFVIILTLVGLFLIASDWQEMQQVLFKANWRFLVLSLLFTFLSYSFYSYAYAIVAKTLEVKMRKRELAIVCFISTVVNHVISTGGVVGYSLRYFLMKMYKVSLKEVLTSSFLHYYLTSLDMLTFLPICIAYLMRHARIPTGFIITSGIMTALLGLVLILITSLVVFPSRRRPIITWLVRHGKRYIRREWSMWLIQLDDTLNCGTDAFKSQPLRLAWVMILTLLDFTCSIIAMGFVFNALGPTVRAEVLVTGYVIGIMVGLISMVPGGLGVQEGSMASIYALLGVSFKQALLASILFRIVYYLLPYLLILPFYNRLVKNAQTKPILEE